MDDTGRRIQCLDRAMDIIEAIADAGDLGVTELSGALDLHVATVHSIVRTLTLRHYLVNDGGRYRLGPAFAATSAQWDPVQAFPGLARPAVKQIVDATGEAASATVLVGTTGRLVAFEPGTEPVTIQYPTWTWEHPMRIATGQVLAAFCPPPLRDRIVARHHEQHRTPSIAEWHDRLDKIRDDGICVLCDASDSGGQAAMAAPVRTRGGAVIAALGVSCPGFRATPEHREQMLNAVQAAATDLSTQLGFGA